MDQDFTAIVVAAGASERFDAPLAKQFHDLSGRSVLERSVLAVAGRPGVRGAVVVLAEPELRGVRGVAAREWPGVLDVVPGGATRAASVERGVIAAGSARYVLVHDAARPLASPALIDRVIAGTREHGAAIPVLPIHDTVKRTEDGRVHGTVDRGPLRLAQTPQGARRDWLLEALVASRDAGFTVTDEASALERAGRKVVGVDGDSDNIKITTEGDLDRVRRRFAVAAPRYRVGNGFDIHRRAERQRPLFLGGLRFDGEPGLEGHSDADVVLHAAMDAALGAAALGDIGVHFPPEDPSLRDASSAALARQVARLVAEAGFSIVNLDVTLLAESPRIRGRVGEMRASIAECFGIEPDDVGVKATTLEGLGALGRGEGAACQATAMLCRKDTGG